MADLSTIKGFEIQSLGADPYTSAAASGTWASGGAMNTARKQFSGAGTQTATITAGGVTGGPSGTHGTATETYNGTAWTETGHALNTSRGNAGMAGTTAGALYIAGYVGPAPIDNVETYNGSSWSESNDVNTARFYGGGAGTTTAAIYYGGYAPPGYIGNTETYNGTSWTETADLNTSRNSLGGVGSTTAALAAGGDTGSVTDKAETWNGTSWTQVNVLNTGRKELGATFAGSTTSALVFGGNNPPTLEDATESWDGSTWTEVADLATARTGLAGTGSSPAALAFGGTPNSPSTGTTTTEEWTTASPLSVAQEGQVWYNTASNVLKGATWTAGTGSWASGGAMNTARSLLFSFGQSNSTGIAASGYTSTGNTANCESYNGTTWTEVHNVNSAYREPGGSFGTQTAGVKAGGRPPNAVDSETWDGTCWTEANDLTSTKNDANSGAGTQTSGLIAGGSPASTNVQTFDGTDWATGTSMNTGRQYIGRAGSSDSAAMSFGGGTPGVTANSETWNGTAWSEGSNLNTARQALVGGGPVTMAMAMAGQTTPTPAMDIVEQYDGTSWTELADLSVSRYGPGSTSNAPGTEMLCFGGYQPDFKNNTEEWTQPTPLAIKTFTSS